MLGRKKPRRQARASFPRTNSRIVLPESVSAPRHSDSRRRRHIAAAGQRVNERDTETLRRLIQPWQQRAYGYYDSVPEVKFGAQFYSRMLAPLRLYAAKIDENGEIQEIEDPTTPADRKAVTHVERIQDPGGGRSGLLGTYGRLFFLGGEGYLVVSTPDDQEEQWEMCSPNELRLNPGGDSYYRLRAPQLAPEIVRNAPDDAFEAMGKDEAVVYRLWRRHPVYSALADSTMQAVLDICEELLLLSRGVRNRTRSRLASAGILIVNGDITSVSTPSADTADENPDEDTFLRDLTEASVAAISDESSTSAVVPIIVRVDMDKDDGGLENVMKHLQIVDPVQLYPESGLRREAIERLAIGLDMPPEALLGVGGLNHWSGWIVDEQSWQLHGQPVAQGFVDDLTAAYYRPTLKQDGVEDWQSYCIGYDAAAVISQPDKAKDAKELHDRGALSNQALREAANFTDDDAPDEQEHQEWLGIKLNDSNVAINGEPAAPVAPFGGPEPTDEETVDAGDTPAEAPKAPPPADDEPPGQVSAALATRLIGASDLAFHRTREVAGSRLRSYAKRNDEATLLIDGIPNSRVPATLGLAKTIELGAPGARELVAGVRHLLEETLRIWGVEASVADALSTRIEQHASKTLFEDPPAGLPRSFENYVRGLEVATR